MDRKIFRVKPEKENTDVTESNKTKQKKASYQINELERGTYNTYYSWDARSLRVPDNSIDMIITSPPYNAGIDYEKWDDELPRDEYEKFVDEFMQEFYRVLKPGGRLAIIIANVGRRPYYNNTITYTLSAEKVGLEKRGEIIWMKGSVSNSIAWGSFNSPSNPSLRDMHEYILIFHKDTPKLVDQDNKTSDLTKEEFMEYTNSIWQIAPTNKKRAYGHPAAFPPEIPYRLIKLYTYPGDVILDPFVGSGTTCDVAKELGRRYIGSDLDLQYIAKRNKIQNYHNNAQVRKQVRTDKRPETIGITDAKIEQTRKQYERAKKLKEQKEDN